MPHAYDTSHPLAFPALPVSLRQIDGDATTMALSALVDSGADVTIVPVGYLRAIGAEQIYGAYLRAHWGGRRAVAVFLVDLEIENQIMPSIEVVGDERGETGTTIVNRLPAPGALSSVSRPPWAVTRSRARVKPKPRP